MGGKYQEVTVPANSHADIQPASGEHWLLLTEDQPIMVGDDYVFCGLYDGVFGFTQYNSLNEIQYFINNSTYIRVENTYSTGKVIKIQASSSDVSTVADVVTVASGSYTMVTPSSPYFRIVRLASGAGDYSDIIVELVSSNGTKTLLQQPSSGTMFNPYSWYGNVVIAHNVSLKMYNKDTSSRNLCYSMTANIG